jgi:hypothetical protein
MRMRFGRRHYLGNVNETSGPRDLTKAKFCLSAVRSAAAFGYRTFAAAPLRTPNPDLACLVHMQLGERYLNPNVSGDHNVTPFNSISAPTPPDISRRTAWVRNLGGPAQGAPGKAGDLGKVREPIPGPPGLRLAQPLRLLHTVGYEL